MAELVVPPSADGQRLDRFLKSARKDIPYALVQKLARVGKIRVDGKRVKSDARLLAGQVLTLPGVGEAQPPSAATFRLHPKDAAMLAAATVYEDEVLLVLNKPAGLPAQAGPGIAKSLDWMLAARYGAANAPKLTHRLDRDTTGLIVFAKTRAAAQAVTAQFAGRCVEKTYLAVLCARPPEAEGDIVAPLAKQEAGQGSRAVVAAHGDHAHTGYKVVRNLAHGAVLVEATPHTGRMNQLRAHFAHIGCPLAGDFKYGGVASKNCGKMLSGQAVPPMYLHAWKLALDHPLGGQRLLLTAPLPPHFNALT